MHNLVKLSAIASIALIACGESEGAPDASTLDANISGTFSLTWSVSDGVSATSCEDVGASSVRVTAVEENSAFGEAFGFNCEDGSGTSPLLVAGTYRITIDLRTGNGRSLISDPIRLNTVEVSLGGDSPIGEVQTFSVVPNGTLSFSVRSESSNCDLVANGGAGIEEFRFSLRNDANQCVNTTFDIAAGGQPAQTYASDCAATVPCVEVDQVSTVDPALSGERTLEIVGLVGGLPCWQGTSVFSIPGNNLSRELGQQQLALNTAEPTCTP